MVVYSFICFVTGIIKRIAGFVCCVDGFGFTMF